MSGAIGAFSYLFVGIEPTLAKLYTLSISQTYICGCNNIGVGALERSVCFIFLAVQEHESPHECPVPDSHLPEK